MIDVLCGVVTGPGAGGFFGLHPENDPVCVPGGCRGRASGPDDFMAGTTEAADMPGTKWILCGPVKGIAARGHGTLTAMNGRDNAGILAGVAQYTPDIRMVMTRLAEWMPT